VTFQTGCGDVAARAQPTTKPIQTVSKTLIHFVNGPRLSPATALIEDNFGAVFGRRSCIFPFSWLRPLGEGFGPSSTTSPSSTITRKRHAGQIGQSSRLEVSAAHLIGMCVASFAASWRADFDTEVHNRVANPIRLPGDESRGKFSGLYYRQCTRNERLARLRS